MPAAFRTALNPTTVEQDPNFANVSLLLHMDGSNASTSFVDSGPNALAITASGNAQISTTQSKFGGASGAFDGTGDYLTVASNSVFNFGTGDFTVEGWVYLSSVSGDWFIASSTGSGGMFFGYASTVSPYGWGIGRTAVAWDYLTASTASINTWYHVAVSRSGTSLRIFVNGTQVGSTATNSQSYNLSTTSLTIASQGTTYYLNGNIDDLRITKGVARYTANFTPPAKAFPNLYNPYTTLPTPGASLWLSAPNSASLFTDAGTAVVTKAGDSVYQWNDLSGNSRNATQATSGNRPTWVAPASGRNGLGAVSFSGSSQYIDRSAGAATQFSGNFTVEMWIKLNAAATQSIFDTRISETSPYGNGFVIASNTSNQYLFYIGGNQITSSAVTTDAWNHLAVCRSGSSIRMFLNGTQTGSTYTSSTNYSDGGFLIGTDYPRNARWFNGQIQNLIIYNGQALYTSNFTPWMS